MIFPTWVSRPRGCVPQRKRALRRKKLPGNSCLVGFLAGRRGNGTGQQRYEAE